FKRRRLVDWPMLARLRRLSRNRHIDVIHAHDAASQFTAALLRLVQPRVRLVLTFRRSLGRDTGTLRDRLRNSLAALQSDAVITGSRERRDYFLRKNWISAGKVIRIPFGVDTSQFSPDANIRSTMRAVLGLSKETVAVGAVGHFGLEKGIDVVLQSFALLARR